MGVTWFRRAGDIPGLEYAPPQPVDGSAIPGFGVEPEVEKHRDLDDRPVESLYWHYDDSEDSYGTTASPGQNHANGALERELSSAARLQTLWEALELPAEPGDYHFAIQGVAGDLWRRKRREPSLLPWVEWLSWLDIRLIRACPNAIRNEFADEFDDGPEYYGVTSFRTLAQMYKREGFLQELHQLAELAHAFEQGGPYIDDAGERLAALRAEDGG